MKSSVIGLIGCGLWGRNILRELTFLQAQVHVFDPDENVRKFASENGAAGTHSSLEASPEVDGYILSTPASLHRSHIEVLSSFGKPIFTEKPFVLNMEDAQYIRSLGGPPVFVMHVWRYHPAIQEIKEMIASGEIGELELIRTRRFNWTSPRIDVDPVWTLLPHDISIFAELTGKVPHAVYAKAELCAGHPVGMLAVTESTCPCVAEVSTRYSEKVREVRLQGSQGTAVLQGDGAQITLNLGDRFSTQPETRTIRVLEEPALRREIATFLDFLQGGPDPKTSLKEAVDITRCLTDLRTAAGLTAN
ncbi:MAG: Gfo/Idh/MocA family oxidoreductase [Verrucomicrobiae bacterium]|nr:Gfo/Idh/MocA family oxidoreductase [Verrucomicrobiae bacterium]